MRRPKTWILIADGARARILFTEGRGSGLTLATERTFAVEHRPTRDLGAERPGRVHESARTGSRHALANPVDWHRFAKESFAREMAKILDKAAARKAFDRLVLVAPAKTLGDLRKALAKATQGLVVHEIAKDLTPFSLKELEGHLGKPLGL